MQRAVKSENLVSHAGGPHAGNVAKRATDRGEGVRRGATPGRKGLFCRYDRTCRCRSRSTSSVDFCKCRAEILYFFVLSHESFAFIL